ncbi:MAG: HIT family protein [Anaerolineae bacterium]|jgi:ATP adenylyltransferase
MERVWSPWRMEYILGDKPGECIFCAKPQEGNDPENLILLRGQHCFVMMNRYPYNNGHLMVVPYAHVDTPTALTGDAMTEMMLEINVCIEALNEAMRPNGFNVGMNLGSVAGAGIKDHMHVHVVPRWQGDTSFMPVISETHVIVESLHSTYEKLKPSFDCRCELVRPVSPPGP